MADGKYKAETDFQIHFKTKFDSKNLMSCVLFKFLDKALTNKEFDDLVLIILFYLVKVLVSFIY